MNPTNDITGQRERMGLNKAQAARAAKVSLPTWNRFERGEAAAMQPAVANRCRAAIGIEAGAPRGSVRYHRGAWRIQVRAGVDQTGKARYVNRTVHGGNTPAGRLRAEAAAREAAAEAEAIKANKVSGRLTLGQAVDLYIEWAMTSGGPHKTGASPVTIRNYRHSRNVVRSIDPDLWATPVEQVTPMDLTDLYKAVTADIGAPTSRGVHGLIHSAIRYAMRTVKGLAIYFNPAAEAEKPPKSRPRKRGARRLTPAVYADVMAYVAKADPMFHAYLAVSAVTGARRSAVVALQWGDIDLDAGVITFERAQVRGLNGTGATAQVVKSLKVDRPYRVHVDPTTVRILRAWRDQVAARGRSVFPTGWVFPHTRVDGKPVNGEMVTTRWTRLRRAYAADAGQLDGVVLHDLRHYLATVLFGQGWDPITVAARLGHQSPATTMDIYADALPARDQAVSEAIEAHFHGGGVAIGV